MFTTQEDFEERADKAFVPARTAFTDRLGVWAKTYTNREIRTDAGKTVSPESHRYELRDLSRYPGHVLRAIRASATNFKGELRR